MDIICYRIIIIKHEKATFKKPRSMKEENGEQFCEAI